MNWKKQKEKNLKRKYLLRIYGRISGIRQKLLAGYRVAGYPVAGYPANNFAKVSGASLVIVPT